MKLLFHRKNTSEKIKEATYNLLANEGYASISMRDIAKEANTSLGQLTYHYQTKERLILVVIDDVINACLAELEEIVNKSENKLKDSIDYFNNLLDEDEQTCRIIMDLVSQALWNKKIKKMLNDFFDKLVIIIYKIYRKTNDEKDAMIKARFFIGEIYGIAIQKALGDNKDEISGTVEYGKELIKHERNSK